MHVGGSNGIQTVEGGVEIRWSTGDPYTNDLFGSCTTVASRAVASGTRISRKQSVRNWRLVSGNPFHTILVCTDLSRK